MTISRCLQGKILIVDDVPNSRELLRAVLEHLGHFVMEAAGGEEALLRFRGTTTDLIFLDLKIPPPAGYELLDHSRRRTLVVGSGFSAYRSGHDVRARESIVCRL